MSAARVSVIIPFRETERGTQRTEHLEWIRAALERLYPSYEVLVASDGNNGQPWSAAKARVNGVRAASGDVLVFLDADTWPERGNLLRAVDLVETGQQQWVTPYRRLLRLSEAQTECFKATGHPDPMFGWTHPHTIANYEGTVDEQAGLVPTVIARALYEQCPHDIRFDGWGAEDRSWGYALETLHGPCWYLPGPAFHLWHEPDPFRTLRRENPKYRGFEYESHYALSRRYLEAKGIPELMAVLVAELRAGVVTQ